MSRDDVVTCDEARKAAAATMTPEQETVLRFIDQAEERERLFCTLKAQAVEPIAHVHALEHEHATDIVWGEYGPELPPPRKQDSADEVTCAHARRAVVDARDGYVHANLHEKLLRFIDQAERCESEALAWRQLSEARLREIDQLTAELTSKDWMVSEAVAACSQMGKLRAALAELIDIAEDAMTYVPDYFAEKHGYAGYVQKAREALGGGK